MKPKIGIIGCGYWGKNLVRNFYQLGALHAICDVNSTALQEHLLQYEGIQGVDDPQKMLSDPEISAVVIASPAETHYRLAKKALLAGKDVFVEKPLALKAKEGEDLVALAERNQKILMVGHVLEYHLAILKLKEWVDSGQLGQIHYIYSNRLNLGKVRREENILWSFAPHDISVLLRLTGEMPIEVTASGGNYRLVSSGTRPASISPRKRSVTCRLSGRTQRTSPPSGPARSAFATSEATVRVASSRSTAKKARIVPVVAPYVIAPAWRRPRGAS